MKRSLNWGSIQCREIIAVIYQWQRQCGHGPQAQGLCAQQIAISIQLAQKLCSYLIELICYLICLQEQQGVNSHRIFSCTHWQGK